MSYTQSIAQPLIRTLTRAASLPAFQLAGYVPNLRFWMGEVRHALEVIAGYPDRFAAMAAAQAEFDVNFPDEAKRRSHVEEYQDEPLQPVITPAAGDTLSRELIAAADRVIERCLYEGLIDVATADDLRKARDRGSKGIGK
jgi:hypothetical protein